MGLMEAEGLLCSLWILDGVCEEHGKEVGRVGDFPWESRGWDMLGDGRVIGFGEAGFMGLRRVSADSEQDLI